MRGADHHNDKLFSYVRPDSRIPADHPLRAIRRGTDTALAALAAQFATLYSAVGHPSIPPEKLLRALLLRAFALPSTPAAHGALSSWMPERREERER